MGSFPYIRRMNWEYISGFFDADGSITLSKVSANSRRTPVISFHNNEMNILVAIRDFIEHETGFKGFITPKKKTEEHHTQAYDLKYSGLPKCMAIGENILSCHSKKSYRIRLLWDIQKVTPRNGKYTKEQSEKRSWLESKFFDSDSPRLH